MVLTPCTAGSTERPAMPSAGRWVAAACAAACCCCPLLLPASSDAPAPAACPELAPMHRCGAPQRTLVGSCASSSSSWLMMASALKSFTCWGCGRIEQSSAALVHCTAAGWHAGASDRHAMAPLAHKALAAAPRRQRTQCVAAAAGRTDRPPCPASCNAQVSGQPASRRRCLEGRGRPPGGAAHGGASPPIHAPSATNLGGIIGCWEARIRPLSLLL